MKLQDMVHLPHIEGYVQLAPQSLDGPAGLEITSRTHESAGQSGKAPRRARHPLHEKLASSPRESNLRSIPVKVMFDRAEHNVHVRYQAWSDSYEHGPGCLGNGETARRLDVKQGIWTSTRCDGPTLCRSVKDGKLTCSLDVRMRVMIDGQADALQTWIVVSKSENTYQSIMGALVQLQADFGGLRHLPLELTTYEMSTRASGYQPFTCMRLGLRSGTSSESAGNLKLKPSAEFEALGAAALKAWNHLVEAEGRDEVPPTTESPGSPEKGFSDANDTGASLFSSVLGAARCRSAQAVPPSCAVGSSKLPQPNIFTWEAQSTTVAEPVTGARMPG